MVWFECGSCGDSLKKPKVQSHVYSCAAHTLTCIDCSRTFDKFTYKSHNTCVTEHQKYAEGATKPGGFASKGFQDGATPAAGGPAQTPIVPVDRDEFLSKRPPWKCSVCNVNCTSLETLEGHASGKKHIRRAQAARNATKPQPAATIEAATNGAIPQVAPSSAAPAEPASKSNGINGSGGAAEAASAKAKPYKWKKLAAGALKANGGTMKVKKLQEAVLGKINADTDEKAKLKTEMLQKLKASSQFHIDGKTVVLKD